MVEVVRTEDFDQWLTKLKDKAGRLRILKRIDRLVNGNPGDVKSVGSGVLSAHPTIIPKTVAAAARLYAIHRFIRNNRAIQYH